MFEEEVDEMAVNNAKKKYGLEGSICMNIQECAYVNGFQQGAEFGYNKAKEWHYIKDGNLPKENENVLIYSNRANHIGFYRNGFWFTSDGCLEDDDDDIEVIAWKEIVLPKESE